MKPLNSIALLLCALTTAPSLLARADEAPAPYAGKPYSGAAIELPGTIQAEHYDIAPDAKSGVTFNYDRDGNRNDVRKTPDAIGMARMGNGHLSIKGEAQDPNGAYLGWTQTGEWTKYSVHVAKAGMYRVGGQFAAAGDDGLLSFGFAPANGGPPITTGPLKIPTTAGHQPQTEVYHVWEKLDDMAQVELPAGDYILTVKIDKNAGFNLDFYTFTLKP